MSNPGLHERVIFMPTGRVPAMTADIDNDPSRQMVSLHEPPRRGSIVLVLLVAGALVAAAVVLMTIGRTQAQP